ncbi:MAG: Putative inner membrane protein [Candidatus Kapaibacterium sp.]|nr:MAG: Putative inner membrane protein [Candidatus Kapabacteria bacterium]
MNQRKPLLSEDWLSLWLGLFIFLLSIGVIFNFDILGWGIKISTWVDLSKAFSTVSKTYSAISPVVSIILTYVFMLVVIGFGNWLLGGNPIKFFYAFTIVFIISFACFVLGNQANIAATTPAEFQKFGINWSLKLTGEAGFIIALIVGLLISNLFPKFAETLKPAITPELYVKTAIVIMGAGVGIKAIENSSLAFSIIFLGLCAILAAYLIFWSVVYFIARKYFKFSREWSAPLASGISICGVSAAIATGAAIRARPVVPIMVSSLVVVFAVVELLILPFLAQQFLWNDPLVAGAWMGLAVKTDGAATASGAIADALILAKAAEHGVFYQKDWVLNTATNVKVFIDVFIGIWAFILAYVWTKYIENGGDRTQKVPARQIWERFPKFVIGYILTFLIFLIIGLSSPEFVKKSVIETKTIEKTDASGNIEKVVTQEVKKIPGVGVLSTNQANVFRTLFFVLTFFTIGLVSNFRKLWEEGIGKLAAIYILALFGFIIWVALIISWLFFHNVLPPTVSG